MDGRGAGDGASVLECKWWKINGMLQTRRVEKPWKEGGMSSRDEGARDGSRRR